MSLIGYARVSTLEQDTALQLDALGRAGVRRIYQDKSSGVGPRPQLRAAISALGSGDTLVVWKLDRIARSLPDLLSIIESVKVARATIKSLTEPIDTSNPIGEFTLQVLGAVAQLERSMIRERVTAGIHASIARGTRWGRPRHLSAEREAELVSDFVSGGHTYSSLAARYGVTWNVAKAAVFRALYPDHAFLRR